MLRSLQSISYLRDSVPLMVSKGALGGLVVACLPLGSKLAEDDGFLRAITVRSTTSFGKEVNQSVLYRKILRYVKPVVSKEGRAHAMGCA
jgi:hypothetical protein